MSTLAGLAAGLAQPPSDCGPVAFWFLNGDMDRAELARQLRLMRAAGIHTVVLHPRAGHTVAYLSEEWFAGIRYCVEVCAALGLKAWLYDEDNWPSGYGGGATLRRYPQGYAKCLAMLPRGGAGSVDPVLRPRLVASSGEHDFVEQLTPWHPAYDDGWYVDLLDEQATRTFIEVTHERYAEALGQHLGTTVTAVFTDEPGFYNHFYDCAPGTIVWTADLPEQFAARAGYELLPHLPKLFGDTQERTRQTAFLETEGPTAATVRRDFYRIVSQLVVERFYLPLKRWCNAHGMALVGHINNEEYLVDHVRLNADFFSAMDGLDVPGLDIIGPRGNYRRAPESIVPKLAASAAHTRGKRQVLSETYGAMGWELSPEEMRRLADWQGVRGVTRLVLHALYYSIAGFRYDESPPSLFFQSPHWPYIPALTRYLSRWTWLLENTRPGAQVAVYYPRDAVRAVTTPQVPRSLAEGMDEEASEAGRLGKAFRELTDALFRSQVDFDVVDDVTLRSAVVGERALGIAGQVYRCLVLPPGEPSLEAKQVMEAARAAGVAVVSGTQEAVVGVARQWATAMLDPPSSQITVTRRRADDGDLFLIVNEGANNYEGTIRLPATGEVTWWDLGVGQVDPWPAVVVEGSTRVAVSLLAGCAAGLGVQAR